MLAYNQFTTIASLPYGDISKIHYSCHWIYLDRIRESSRIHGGFDTIDAASGRQIGSASTENAKYPGSTKRGPKAMVIHFTACECEHIHLTVGSVAAVTDGGAFPNVPRAVECVECFEWSSNTL